MANRVLIGKHASFGYGLFVSKPTKDVTGSTHDDFAFRSDLTDSGGYVTSANGKVFRVVDQQSDTITFGSSTFVVAANFYYNRSLFTSGGTDRCPLVLVSSSVRGDHTVQNTMGFNYYRTNTVGQTYRTSQGIRYRHYPYWSTTQGRVQVNVQAEARGVYASGTEAHYNMTGLSEADWPGTDTSTRTVYMTLCDLELR